MKRLHEVYERALSRCVRASSGCLEFTGAKRMGYGRVSWYEDGKPMWKGTHELACLVHHGPPPSDKHIVMHSCDNPACCEPSHLSWGTYSDNSKDRNSKSRNYCVKGSSNGRTNLTEDDVRAIRSSNASTAELAEKYGIQGQSIKNIVTRKTWSHVKD